MAWLGVLLLRLEQSEDKEQGNQSRTDTGHSCDKWFVAKVFNGYGCKPPDYSGQIDPLLRSAAVEEQGDNYCGRDTCDGPWYCPE